MSKSRPKQKVDQVSNNPRVNRVTSLFFDLYIHGHPTKDRHQRFEEALEQLKPGDIDTELNIRHQEGDRFTNRRLTILMLALLSSSNDSTPLEIALKKKPNINVVTKNDNIIQSALLIAVRNVNNEHHETSLKNIKLLLEHGANPRLKEYSRTSILETAVESKHAQIMELITEHLCANLHNDDIHIIGMALQKAIELDDMHAVKFILDSCRNRKMAKGATLSHREFMLQLMQFPMAYKDISGIYTTVEMGIPPDSFFNLTSLAIILRKPQSAQFLISFTQELSLLPKKVVHPLLAAVMQNDIDTLDCYLKHEYNLRNNDGITKIADLVTGSKQILIHGTPIIIYACRLRSYEFVKQLLDYGADPNTIDNDGRPALWNAIHAVSARYGIFDNIRKISELLVERGARIDYVDTKTGDDYLSLLLKNRDLIPIEDWFFDLIKDQFDLSQKRVNGFSALHSAARQYRIPLLRAIAKHLYPESVSKLNLESNSKSYVTNTVLACGMIGCEPDIDSLNQIIPCLFLDNEQLDSSIINVFFNLISKSSNKLLNRWKSTIEFVDVMEDFKELSDALLRPADIEANQIPELIITQIKKLNSRLTRVAGQGRDIVMMNLEFATMAMNETRTNYHIGASMLMFSMIFMYANIEKYLQNELSYIISNDDLSIVDENAIHQLNELLNLADFMIYNAEKIISMLHPLNELSQLKLSTSDINRSLKNSVAYVKDILNILKKSSNTPQNVTTTTSHKQDKPQTWTKREKEKIQKETLTTSVDLESVYKQSKPATNKAKTTAESSAIANSTSILANESLSSRKRKQRRKRKVKTGADHETVAHQPQQASSSNQLEADTNKLLATQKIGQPKPISERLQELDERIQRRQAVINQQTKSGAITKTVSEAKLRRLERKREMESSYLRMRDEFSTVFDLFENDERLFLVGGSVINFRMNKQFDKTKGDVDLLYQLHNKDIEKKFRRSMFCSSDTYDLYTYKSDGLSIDMLGYKTKINLSQDAQNRDFTICAVYLWRGAFIDPTGFGLPDIDNKVLRVIGDTKSKLDENPVRILRALKYISRGFKPDANLREYLLNWTEEKLMQLSYQLQTSFAIKKKVFQYEVGQEFSIALAQYKESEAPAKSQSSITINASSFFHNPVSGDKTSSSTQQFTIPKRT